MVQRTKSSESVWEDQADSSSESEESSEEDEEEREETEEDEEVSESDSNDQDPGGDHANPLYPSYLAVSYAWGQPPTFESIIELESGSLQISDTAAGALRRFRRRKTRISLWIDSICINQQDDDEKNEQVAIMGDIYREAKAVLVWLGEAASTDCYAFHIITASRSQKEAAASSKWFVSENAMMQTAIDPLDDKPYAIVTPKKCPRCSAKVRVKKGNPLPLEEKLFSDEPFGTRRQTGLLGSTGTNDYTLWDSIQIVLQRPYFRRLWPLQEVLIPGERRTWYFAGAHYAHAILFHHYALFCIKLFGSIDGFHDSLNRRFMQLALRDTDGYRKRLLEQIIDKKDAEPSSELLEIILDSSSMDSTIPHDRIYALRALMKGSDAQALIPNYSTPIKSLWQQVVRLHMQSESPDSVLLALAGRQKCTGLVQLETSWFPDFHYLPSGPSLAKLSMHRAASSSFKLQTSDWISTSTNAKQTGEIHQLFERTDYPNDLRRIKDWVETRPEFARTFKHLDLDMQWRSTAFIKWILYPWYYGLWCKLSEVAHAHSKTLIIENLNEFIRQGIPGTAKSGIFHEESDIEEVEERTPDVWIQETVGNMQSHIAKFVFRFKGYKPKSPMSSIDHGPMKSLPFPWERKASWIDHHRILCSLEDGRVGWIPDAGRVGDGLWLLEGCSIPFLLRRREDGTFENFGDTYFGGVGMVKPLWKQDTILQDLCIGGERMRIEIR